jgi:hypothetical protein
MRRRRLCARALVFGAPLLVGAIVGACNGSTSPTTSKAPTTAAAPVTARAPDVVVTARSFRALSTMTAVRGFFVDNLLGNLDATLAVARSRAGGEYPPGTLLQLVPQEAMVKHRPGFDRATNDWEFFFLDVSAKGTKVVTRGTDKVVNRFGGNCASCHVAAKEKFDFVCEHDHGCAPLPVSDDLIRAVQRSDPRPAGTKQ